jgi:NADPH:quinone reductase-like Zn-dependent oxidoreductase
MKAIVCDGYGPPDQVLRFSDVDEPVLGDDQVLVRVQAASVNPADWHLVRGEPYLARLSFGLRKPKYRVPGCDLAGSVEAVGSGVTTLKAGDEVYGSVFMKGFGAFAERAVAPERVLAPKPAALTFEQAAAVPVAGLTALQGLRDHGRVEAGQRVLIIGAAGGVGTFAVQIAKALGAEVTGVCSTGKVDLDRSLGADHVVDYTQEDFTRTDERYHLMLDVAGSRSWSACKRVLKPDATLVLVGGPKANRMFGPLGHVIRLRLGGLLARRNVTFFIAKLTKEDMVVLRELLEAGKVKPVVERRYELSEIADALRYLGEGHARAKIVITI